MRKLSICFIDILGLPYNGNTLKTKGLGGSESAVIYIAQELSKIGFDVTVYNNCDAPGKYNNVEYTNITENPLSSPNFDITVVLRSVAPFLDNHRFPFITSSKRKILWMHDTFCDGDNDLEHLLLNGTIDEVFTLSDFHTTYFSTAHHGRRRNPEVLKRKIFMTRNGVKRHIMNVNINKKDKNLFVYNASQTKGLTPLVEKIWPKIKQKIPSATLIVIGGYYRFANNQPDEQEKRVREYMKDSSLEQMHVKFTGIISQQEIAHLLARASFMIYPGAFPETFGISTLESLTYNTPLITTRFGALEETAIEQACYLMDYAIEPNSLYPDINTDEQVSKFVDMAEKAYTNTYLHQQKMQYCNIVHEISGWDTIALQWKQHFYKTLGLYLSVDEYRTVSHINQRVHTIFNRRFSNPEDLPVVKSIPQNRFDIIIPFYNAEQYIERCLNSVLSQDYDNFHIWLIDDHSSDDSKNKVLNLLDNNRLGLNCHIFNNPENRGALANQLYVLENLPNDSIVILLDGDDALINRNDVLQFYNNLYQSDIEMTYGSCWSEIDNIPLVSEEYPYDVRLKKSYRRHSLTWGIPYTHLRTFRKKIFSPKTHDEFKDEKGEYYKSGGDGALFYHLLEHAHPNKIKVVRDITMLYNDISPLNDYKIHREEQTKNANRIRDYHA